MMKKKVFESNPANTIFFMTYNPTCVALYKITEEFKRKYDELKMGYRYLKQEPPYGPYRIQQTDKRDYKVDELPNLVLHRGGTHNFRPEWARFIYLMIRERRITGHPTTYYLDDFLTYMNNYLPVEILRKCDKVITLGYLLKNHLVEKHGIENVHQMKTHIDVKQYDMINTLDPIKDDKRFKMIWFSMARTGLGFMDELFKKINQMPEAKDMRFLCITPQAAKTRAKLYSNRNVNAEYIEFVHPTVLAAMEKSCDLLINPIHVETDNFEFVPEGEDRKIFMDAKSEIKYIHSGAVKTPLLTGSSLPYETAIKNGENGFISDDVDEWIELILKMKDDSELGKKVAEAANEDIVANYNSEDRFKEYLDLIVS